jgi:hemerythrin
MKVIQPQHSSTQSNRIPTHDDLRETAQRLRAILAQGDPDRIYAHLHQFVRAITRHFADENQPNGLFAEVERQFPRLVPQIAILRKQHDEILRSLNGACADIDDELETVIPLIEESLELIRRHEAEEEKIIREVFFRDDEPVSNFTA